jgi:hypothetical protein
MFKMFVLHLMRQDALKGDTFLWGDVPVGRRVKKKEANRQRAKHPTKDVMGVLARRTDWPMRHVTGSAFSHLFASWPAAEPARRLSLVTKQNKITRNAFVGMKRTR